MQDSSKGVLISIAKITKLVVSLGIAGRIEIHAGCMTLALPDISCCSRRSDVLELQPPRSELLLHVVDRALVPKPHGVEAEDVKHFCLCQLSELLDCVDVVVLEPHREVVLVTLVKLLNGVMTVLEQLVDVELEELL